MSTVFTSERLASPMMRDTTALDALQSGLSKISVMVENLRRGHADGDSGPDLNSSGPAQWPFATRALPSDEAVTADHVRMIIRNRRLREEAVGSKLFSDPAWDMMLDLYAAHLDRKRVSVSSLCIASAVPSSTALRWIGLLADQGLVERVEDHLDGRRIWVQLTALGQQRMRDYFQKSNLGAFVI